MILFFLVARKCLVFHRNALFSVVIKYPEPKQSCFICVDKSKSVLNNIPYVQIKITQSHRATTCRELHCMFYYLQDLHGTVTLDK